MPSATPAANGVPDGHVKLAPALQVSPLDTRSYRALTLHNELDVLLISDSSSDKAAASLNVSVGSFSDPEQLPGLAHFSEHMLFLGTKKYPDEGSYNTFLAENGGQSNAYTAPESTNFHFDMLVSDPDPNHPSPRFREALDRFAQFFTAPLFTESATDRELNAVHSEHQKNLQSDERRMYQLKSSCANKLHPFSRFSTGSKETLHDIPRDSGIDVRAEMLKFHDANYSANLMSLCIIAPYSLDLLQTWTIDLFSAIPNHHRQDPSEEYKSIKPLLDEQCGLIYHVESVRDIRVVEISWITESYINDYKTKPSRLLASLLGDEGEGSLLSLLKMRGWCDGLTAGPAEMDTFGLFFVSVTLTNEGIEHIDEIVATTFQYIRMLRKEGIPKRVYEEESGLAEIAFRFREREDPISLVMRMSSKMPTLPPAEYLSGQYLLTKFDEDKLNEVLNVLTPEKCNIMIAGKFMKCEMNKKERWYGTPYRVEPISSERLKQWEEGDIHSALHLPPVNQFIPHDFDLIGEALPEGEKDTEGPLLIEKNEHFELRHKLDRTFRRPRAKIILKLMSPLVYASPWHSMMTSLFCALLEDSLTEFSYPAERAGFGYELDKTESGLFLIVSGYSHRIDVLLNAVVHKMVSFEADETRFEMQKDILYRKCVNFDKGQPYQLAVYNLSYLLEDPRWHIRDYLKLFRDGKITRDGVNTFAKDVLRRLWVNGLVCGNISSDDAISIIRGMQQTLGYEPIAKAELSHPRVVQVPVGKDVFLRKPHPNDEDNNSAIQVFYQLGARGSPETDVRIELLGEILNKPAFHELRTVQQLGYIVFEGLLENEGIRGLFVIVQSTVADPDELLKRIDTFMGNARKDIFDVMTEEKFDDYVKALVATKAEPARSISGQTSRFWSEIDRGFLMFDRRAKEIEALQSVKKEEVIQLFDEVIAVGGCRRKRVVSQLFGNQHPFEKRKVVDKAVGIEVEDEVRFRKCNPLYAVVGQAL